MCQLWLDLEGRLTSVQYPNHEISEDNFIIQQYTGVEDIDGKELYEGDIVGLDFGYNKDWIYENLFEIIFEQGAFCLKTIKLSKPQGNGVGGGLHTFTHTVFIVGHDDELNPIYRYELPLPQPIYNYRVCKYLGNIFENKELLEEL